MITLARFIADFLAEQPPCLVGATLNDEGMELRSIELNGDHPIDYLEAAMSALNGDGDHPLVGCDVIGLSTTGSMFRLDDPDGERVRIRVTHCADRMGNFVQEVRDLETLQLVDVGDERPTGEIADKVLALLLLSPTPA